MNKESKNNVAGKPSIAATVHTLLSQLSHYSNVDATKTLSMYSCMYFYYI